MGIERIDIAGAAPRAPIRPLPMGGVSPTGESLGVNSYYLERDGRPYFGVSGEFHFSRCDARDWRDELIKMRMCGVGIVSTYVFWNHHEEEQGTFDWSGRRDLRRFVLACGELGLWAIVRIGPWAHGEARNGGLPDWLYGQPFDLRSNDPGYLELVARLYGEIGAQLRGLYFKDGGPVIGTQLENEYMHAGAPWEMTTGVSDEWVESGRDGEAHIRELLRLAREAGIDTPLYTCTAWGGAAAPLPETLPLWGGYSFQPWLFYGDIAEHPATPEYAFRDYHSDAVPRAYNFEPRYAPESLPYACCEMGGGMACFYKYRFKMPPAAVEAMAVVKAAGGCNFLGYYMFHGGTNPRGSLSPFLNEHALPKLSYDYQAAIGEFGQVREHAKGLALLHHLFRGFEDRFCRTTTVLPAGASSIDPRDADAPRFAARAEGRSGFLFLNNYQDHFEMRDREGLAFELALPGGPLRIPREGGLRLKRGVACVLPFHFDLDGVDLAYATAQPIARIPGPEGPAYFFCSPEGMEAEYRLDEGSSARLEDMGEGWLRVVGADGSPRLICTLSRSEALRFWKAELGGRAYALLSEPPVLVDAAGDRGDAASLRLECVGDGPFELAAFPPLPGASPLAPARMRELGARRGFARYAIELPAAGLRFEVERRGERKAALSFDPASLPPCKRAILRVEYEGDIGNAYAGGALVSDNFSNGEAWDIDLLRVDGDPLSKGLVLDVRPTRVGGKVRSDTSMAGRSAEAERELGSILGLRAMIVRDAVLRLEGR
jgi:hypothetical protein